VRSRWRRRLHKAAQTGEEESNAYATYFSSHESGRGECEAFVHLQQNLPGDDWVVEGLAATVICLLAKLPPPHVAAAASAANNTTKAGAVLVWETPVEFHLPPPAWHHMLETRLIPFLGRNQCWESLQSILSGRGPHGKLQRLTPDACEELYTLEILQHLLHKKRMPGLMPVVLT